ncbi:response regulator [Halolamina salifodinae]|uniref:CheY-like chemotaxis protein n=1 Tax=Halolamina salifodinae TaxID=1202767 RepID=A0A8T4GZB1_9EURY|nr:response regulator [Halolamina salifodinae]MBP1988321.1 CheY-like chemotaxis protein [Halolamina salifodinae]
MSDPEEADVLLVEDNPGDVRLTQEAFRQGDADSTLHVVDDGVEALDFCYRREAHADAPRPDIVLLDLNLPRKDGREVLAALKQDPDLCRIPVIVLTSSAARTDVAESYDHSANAYLTKPVDPEEFISTIDAFTEFWLSTARLPNRAE